MSLPPYRSDSAVGPEMEQESPRDLWDLWIVGPAVEVKSELLKASGASTMLIRTSPPGDSGELSPGTLTLIADAIAKRAVRCVVVCGQPDDATDPAANDLNSSAGEMCGYDQMLLRMSRRKARERCVHDRILTQLHQIRAHPGIAAAVKSQRIALCGVFYVPESDAFLVYVPAEGRFVPLAEARFEQ